MTQLNQIYKCPICGNIVEITHVGAGTLVCCGQNMTLMEEKKLTEEGQEKHVPIIEKTETGILVKVGSVPHPMEETHYIEWLEILFGNKLMRHYLSPESAPEAYFEVKAENITARAYCNIHGLWGN
ncbi:MAG TPA: desulfoferrodoxin [bacterium]|nr:desulfoferrodoxin [bacterium]